MNRSELETYCRDNGIPCETVGDKFRVMDLSRMPDVLRARFDERGFLNPEQVSEQAEVATPAKALRGKLPDDFPGHSALMAEGLTTYAKVRKRLDTLTEIQGIGEATAEKIMAALNESSEDEEEQDAQ